MSGFGPRIHLNEEPLSELGELEILGKVVMSVPPMVTNKPPLVHAKMLSRVVVAERPALAELDLGEERRRPTIVGVAAAVTHLCANQPVRWVLPCWPICTLSRTQEYWYTCDAACVFTRTSFDRRTRRSRPWASLTVSHQ